MIAFPNSFRSSTPSLLLKNRPLTLAIASGLTTIGISACGTPQPLPPLDATQVTASHTLTAPCLINLSGGGLEKFTQQQFSTTFPHHEAAESTILPENPFQPVLEVDALENSVAGLDYMEDQKGDEGNIVTQTNDPDITAKNVPVASLMGCPNLTYQTVNSSGQTLVSSGIETNFKASNPYHNNSNYENNGYGVYVPTRNYVVYMIDTDPDFKKEYPDYETFRKRNDTQAKGWKLPDQTRDKFLNSKNPATGQSLMDQIKADKVKKAKLEEFKKKTESSKKPAKVNPKPTTNDKSTGAEFKGSDLQKSTTPKTQKSLDQRKSGGSSFGSSSTNKIKK